MRSLYFYKLSRFSWEEMYLLTNRCILSKKHDYTVNN